MKSHLKNSDDWPMTARWLPDDCLMTPDDCLMTTWWLPDDCPITAWWLSDDCPITAWWLPDHFLMTARSLPDDCLMTAWWLNVTNLQRENAVVFTSKLKLEQMTRRRQDNKRTTRRWQNDDKWNLRKVTASTEEVLNLIPFRFPMLILNLESTVHQAVGKARCSKEAK